jgi:hypothetical protein
MKNALFTLLIVILIAGIGVMGYFLVFKAPDKEVPTPTPEIIFEPELTTIEDDLLVFSISIPDYWTDSEGGGLYNQYSQLYGASLHVAESLPVYYSKLNASGLIVSVLPFILEEDADQMQAIGEMLDKRNKDVAEVCLFYGREEIDQENMFGYVDTFKDCNSENTDLTFFVSATMPSDGEDAIVIMEYRATNSWEIEQYPFITSSLLLLNTPPSVTGKLYAYDPYWNPQNPPHRDTKEIADDLGLITAVLPIEYQHQVTNSWVATNQGEIGSLLVAAPDLDLYLSADAPGVTMGVNMVNTTSTHLLVERREDYQDAYNCASVDYSMAQAEKNKYFIYTLSDCEFSDASFFLAATSPETPEIPYNVIIEFTYFNDRDYSLVPDLLNSLNINYDNLIEQDYLRWFSE